MLIKVIEKEKTSFKLNSLFSFGRMDLPKFQDLALLKQKNDKKSAGLPCEMCSKSILHLETNEACHDKRALRMISIF